MSVSSVANIKEQLIALKIEIEDKDKVIRLLERKAEIARQDSARADEKVVEQYKSKLEAISNQQKYSAEDLHEKTQDLIKKKANLIEECKRLMETIKDTERDIAAEIRGIMREGEDQIETERKRFKLGCDERLQKYLSDKNSEYKESTARALEPEFRRLQSLHEQEMEELRMSTMNEERKLKDQMKARMEALKEEELYGKREEVKLSLKAIQEKYARDLEYIAKEFKVKQRRKQEELDIDLEKIHKNMKAKANKRRAEYHKELQDAQEQSQNHLIDLKKKHAEHLDTLQREHEEKVWGIKRDHHKEKQLLQVSEESSSSPSRRGHLHFRDESPKKSPGRRLGGDKSANGNFEGDKLPAELQEKLDIVRREAEANRDKLIQQQIRSIETETIRLERELNDRLERERRSILESEQKEEESLTRRNRHLTDEIADIVVEREQFYQANVDEARKVEALRAEISEVKREIEIYRDGISAQRNYMRDKEDQHKLALRELQLQHGPASRAIESELESISKERRDFEFKWNSDVAAMEKVHAEELSRLDNSVKTEVAKLDSEMNSLREELEAEDAAEARLRLLISKYESNGSSLEIGDDEELELRTTKSKPSKTFSKVSNQTNKITGNYSSPPRQGGSSSSSSSIASSRSNSTISTASNGVVGLRSASAGSSRLTKSFHK